MQTMTQNQPDPTANNNNNINSTCADVEETYTIEKILKHKKQTDGSYLYLVKWEGFPDTPANNTWEPESNFDYPTVIHNYWNQLSKVSKKSAASQRQDRRRT
jgi:hypothetical protein